MCSAVFEHGRAQQLVPAGWGQARLPSRCPWLRGSGCLAPVPQPPPMPQLPVLPSAWQDEHRLPYADACQIESPGSRESWCCAVAMPGPPAGGTRGAGRGSRGCWDSLWLMCRVGHRHVDESPPAPGACGGLCAWGGGRAAGAPDACPSPTDTRALPRLRSLPQALLPWEPRGGARSPSPLPRAQCRESQVRHMTNLICGSR